jgi:hypothetical protein
VVWDTFKFSIICNCQFRQIKIESYNIVVSQSSYCAVYLKLPGRIGLGYVRLGRVNSIAQIK